MQLSPTDDIIASNKCLDAAEERVRDQSKMNELRSLTDKVYTARVDEIQWDFGSTIELHGDNRLSAASTNNDKSDSEEAEDSPLDAPTAEFSYKANEIIVVSPGDGDCLFWFAKTIGIADRDDAGSISLNGALVLSRGGCFRSVRGKVKTVLHENISRATNDLGGRHSRKHCAMQNLRSNSSRPHQGQRCLRHFGKSSQWSEFS